MRPNVTMPVAGATVSALGHAALIALALWALPWMRVRPAPPLPAVSVSLLSEADLAGLARRAAAARPAPAPSPSPEVAARPQISGPRFLPPPEPEPQPEPPPLDPEDFGLAPSFDAASPLGLPEPAATPPPAVAAPEAAATEPEADEEADAAPAELAALRERHMRALSAAVLRARVYPPAARGRGLMGTARVYLEIGRDGSLIEAGLMTTSGSASLDRAALEAARRARFPAAPEALPGASFAFMQDLEFEAR
ncbi:MAG TPA: TonB family protein [Amaricoccus sp.]|nr:TonB family protein [Amaricoccus sp.]